MTNEKDREEARRIIAAHDNCHLKDICVDQLTIERVAIEIARIRSEAVKTERERIISDITRLSVINVNMVAVVNLQSAIDAILSPDQSTELDTKSKPSDEPFVDELSKWM